MLGESQPSKLGQELVPNYGFEVVRLELSVSDVVIHLKLGELRGMSATPLLTLSLVTPTSGSRYAVIRRRQKYTNDNDKDV